LRSITSPPSSGALRSNNLSVCTGENSSLISSATHSHPSINLYLKPFPKYSPFPYHPVFYSESQVEFQYGGKDDPEAFYTSKLAEGKRELAALKVQHEASLSSKASELEATFATCTEALESELSNLRIENRELTDELAEYMQSNSQAPESTDETSLQAELAEANEKADAHWATITSMKEGALKLGTSLKRSKALLKEETERHEVSKSTSIYITSLFYSFLNVVKLFLLKKFDYSITLFKLPLPKNSFFFD
jgi:hypothetical protein